MSGKDLKGSGRGLIEVLFRNLLRGTEEYRENASFRIVGVSAEIRTEHFSNTSLRP
jgi:hypothetical protein